MDSAKDQRQSGQHLGQERMLGIHAQVKLLKIAHPCADMGNLVALMHGPLVLMAVADSQPSFDRNELLRAKPAENGAGDWQATAADGSSVTMRPFMNIDKESYSTYVLLKS